MRKNNFIKTFLLAIVIVTVNTAHAEYFKYTAWLNFPLNQHYQSTTATAVFNADCTGAENSEASTCCNSDSEFICSMGELSFAVPRYGSLPDSWSYTFKKHLFDEKIVSTIKYKIEERYKQNIFGQEYDLMTITSKTKAGQMRSFVYSEEKGVVAYTYATIMPNATDQTYYIINGEYGFGARKNVCDKKKMKNEDN